MKLFCHFRYKTWEASFLRLLFLRSESYALLKSLLSNYSSHVFSTVFLHPVADEHNHKQSLQLRFITWHQNSQKKGVYWLKSNLAIFTGKLAEVQKKPISSSLTKTWKTNFYSKLTDWWTVQWAILIHTLFLTHVLLLLS